MVEILNDMEREYSMRVDDLIESWKTDLNKNFTQYSSFDLEIGLFTSAYRQLALLNDPQSNHSLRQTFKKNCQNVPQIKATILSYEARTVPADRTLLTMINDIQVFGQAHAITIAAGFAGQVVSGESITISELLAVIANITSATARPPPEGAVTNPVLPKATTSLKRRSNIQNQGLHYCFEHGYGTTHSGHECKKMVDSGGSLRPGYTTQMILCKQPGIMLVDANGVMKTSKVKAT
jgi:hypothetical protein